MSSIYDDSVLIQVPSGYGVGKLYSVIPNTPVGDFDVTRSSWTTRVNKYGYIENVVANVPRLNYDSGVVCPYLLTEDAGTNLLTYPISFGDDYWIKSGSSIEADPSTAGSELVTNGDFATDTDWTKGSSWSISGGKATYDAIATGQELRQLMSSIAVGTTVKIQFDILDVEAGKDAFFKLEISGVPEAVFAYTYFTSGTYTYYHTITSGFDRLTFFALNSGTGGAFSIDNVSAKEVQGFEAPKVLPSLGSELVTNGSFTGSASGWALGTGWAYSSNAINATSTSSICYQDIAAMQSNKTYTVTYQISNYSGGNIQWRFGGSGTVDGATRNANGTYTEYFTNTSSGDKRLFLSPSGFTGTIDNVSVKEITTCSWSGGGFEREAFKLVEDTANSRHRCTTDNILTSLGNPYTFYVYAKADTRDWIGLEMYGVGDRMAWFDIANGVVGTKQVNITSSDIVALANGWYRCSITLDAPGAQGMFGVFLADADNSYSYTGDGTSGIYIAYAQLEENDYASSLMLPANSVEGSTTSRVADAITGAGDTSLFSGVNSSGVLYCEIAANSDDGTTRGIGMRDSTTLNRLHISYTATTNQIYAEMRVGSGVADLYYTLADETEFSKLAFRWAVDDFSLWVDGVERATDISGITFAANTLSEVVFNNGSGSNPFYGKTKALAVFDYLYDDQMELLTGDSYATYEALAMAEDYIIL